MTCKSIAAALLAGASLVLVGCETVAESVTETHTASLSGAQEVPGPGDPDGSGNAEVSIVNETNNVCFEINDVRGIDPATAAHIHRGGPGVAGPAVVTLRPPTDGESQGCVQTADAIADEIKGNPGNFYINVHNAAYPEGAIRGQLRDND